MHRLTEAFVSLNSIGYTILSLVSWSSADGGRIIFPPCSSDSLSLPLRSFKKINTFISAMVIFAADALCSWTTELKPWRPWVC